MTHPPRSDRRCFQHGSAAIEFIFIMIPILVLMAYSLFLARVFWDYSVAQKAAHDAVRYLATASASDMAAGPVGREKPAAAVARKIAETETADLNPGIYGIQINVQCDSVDCSRLGPPKSVRVVVSMTLFDDVFYDYTSGLTGPYGLLLVADVVEPYVGN